MMAKKLTVQNDVVQIPVSLAVLLTAKPEDFKDISQYEAVQVLAKEMLKLLSTKAIIWGD